MKLCHSCRDINFANLDRSTNPYRKDNLYLASEWVLHPSPEDFLQSAQDGCLLCAKLWTFFTPQTKPKDERRDSKGPSVVIAFDYLRDEHDWLSRLSELPGFIGCGFVRQTLRPVLSFPGK